MKASVTIPLSNDEKILLMDHEATISGGLRSFVAVGTALLEISEKRLYRETHGSFEPYCKEKWSMSARRAYQLCEAAKVVNTLPDCEKFYTVGESQARELAKVPSEKRGEVIEKAKAKGKLTARAIKEVASQPTQSPSVDDQWKDALGNPDIDPEHCEPRVVEYYERLQSFVEDALDNASDKQLNSMSVFAATIPKLVKAQLEKRKQVRKAA